jgi:hypothetical protein
MTPRPSKFNVLNGGMSHTKSSGNDAAFYPVLDEGFYLYDACGGKFCKPGGFSSRMFFSALAHHVVDVIKLASKKKVRGVDASFVIARVANILTNRNVSEIHPPRCAVGDVLIVHAFSAASVPYPVAMPILYSGANPHPTTAKGWIVRMKRPVFIYLLKKEADSTFGKLVAWGKNLRNSVVRFIHINGMFGFSDRLPLTRLAVAF